MTLLVIDPASDIAPYEQVRTQVAAMVARGELDPGQKLPTVRQLASDLGLAANTVARAYRELEADRIISTRGRRGTFVRSPVLDDGRGDHSRLGAHEAATALTTSARALGLSLAETTRLVEDAWSQPGRQRT